MSTYTIAVLLSGSGTNLQAMLDAQDESRLNARIGLVVSDRSDAYGIQRALQRSIPAAFVPLTRPPRGNQSRTDTRAQWEQQLVTVINAFAPDLIVLAGFMRILSSGFLDACVAPVINQHPAL